MISVAEAHRLVLKHTLQLPSEKVSLENLEGRILAEDIYASRPQPPFDRVAMDGVAIALSASSEKRSLSLAGVQRAGFPPLTLKSDEQAIEVMTGAILPLGANVVVPYECCHLEKDRVEIDEHFELIKDKNIHLAGSDYGVGEKLLQRGERLTSPAISLLASSGVSQVEVVKFPRVAIISTGDELVPPGQTCRPWQIWRSNPLGMAAQLKMLGIPPQNIEQYHVNDDFKALFSLLEKVLHDDQLILLSGGVSAGKYDFVDAVLADLGVTIHFHKVAQRPGRPLLFATGRVGQCLFGLPGNPVSALTCMRRYVLPALQSSLGTSSRVFHAVLREELAFKKKLTLFAPVQVESNARGELCATPVRTNGSGDFFSLAKSHGFCELPADVDQHPVGAVYPLYFWPGISC